MFFARLVGGRRLIVAFALAGLGVCSGCENSAPSGGTSGTAVQNPEEVKKRETMIQDYYKSNPPKGPGGAAKTGN